MVVSGEYQVRPPMAPTHFFLIEVSQPALASGATAAACAAIAKLLGELPGGERTQVSDRPSVCTLFQPKQPEANHALHAHCLLTHGRRLLLLLSGVRGHL